jgi:recombination protein RecA
MRFQRKNPPNQEVPLDEQISKRIEQAKDKEKEDSKKEVCPARIISTGSTLLDLAISGGIYPEGGIPFGIMVEVFGPSGSGKTVLLCEIAGRILREGGNVMFHDPEGRLNFQFANLFGVEKEKISYTMPNTISEVFRSIREWEPKNPDGPSAIFADSLAALSTEMEMEDEDKMGMRRAKEFSEELRKTCRVLASKGYLLICSNQIRQNLEAGPFGQKYISPGGEAIGFYSSLRLRTSKPKPIKQEKTIGSKTISRIVGVEVQIEVFKSSIWKPFRSAPLTILYDYGIDDIRENLQYVKEMTGSQVYCVEDEKLSKSLEKSIAIVEKRGLQDVLKRQVIRIWNEVEDQFTVKRLPRFANSSDVTELPYDPGEEEETEGQQE